MWVFETEVGSRVEVFAPSYPGRDYFVTGPVAGFAVDDLDSATTEPVDTLVEFRQAVTDPPQDPEAWYWLAVTRDNPGMEATAVACYERAVQLGCAD